LFGETLCWSGTYTSGLTISNSDFTLRNTPGLTGVISGGSGFTVVGVYGDNITLSGLEVNGGGTKNCVLLDSSPSNSTVDDVTLSYMRLHACGNDSHEHAVYAEMTNRLHIADSWLYASGGFGLHFYPNADDTLVEYTVIDGNDTGTGTAANVVFASGDTEYPAGTKSERDVLSHDLITYASPGSNQASIMTSWDSNGGVGTGHVIRDSCIYSPGDAELSGTFPPTLTNITRVDPQYTNRATGDFRHAACLGYGPR
jgi:hypothetical protein